ncbi:hypothetical protein CDL15_Pgr000659 [Punica granatum]|uniref:Uncharacterized protein n=1 Tax=Punica granatum TaxID=22663 RepID=A0A218W2Y6_PUNGR|nr:hypothetical protein CDL15_Pgr000659 [Punica granatum]
MGLEWVPERIASYRAGLCPRCRSVDLGLRAGAGVVVGLRGSSGCWAHWLVVRIILFWARTAIDP